MKKFEVPYYLRLTYSKPTTIDGRRAHVYCDVDDPDVERAHLAGPMQVCTAELTFEKNERGAFTGLQDAIWIAERSYARGVSDAKAEIRQVLGVKQRD